MPYRNLFQIFILFGAMLLNTATSSGEEEREFSITVHNKGKGGQNSLDGRKRFARDVLALAPTHLFIYFGLNDALNEPKFLSEKDYLRNLTWMVDEAQKAKIKVTLCTIHPVGEEALLKRHKPESYGKEGPNGKIDRYNRALRKLAEAKKVPVADFAQVVAASKKTGKTLISSDGVHPTPSGYRALAKCFYKEAVDGITNETVIVCLGDSVTWGARVKGPGTTIGETYPAYLVKISNEARKGY